jgi:serine/threonine-protein kinase
MDYLSGDERDPALVTELSRILEKPPSLGMWLDWIERILEAQGKTSGRCCFGPIQDVLNQSTRRQIRHLVERRNRWAHSGTQFELKAFRQRVFTLMQQLHTFHLSSLFSPVSSSLSGALHQIRAVMLQGDNPNLGEFECRSSIPLESGKVYLHETRARLVLCLHPLVAYEACEECDGKHYFQLSRLKANKLILCSVPEGHERFSKEGYATLAAFFRSQRPFRAQPRHFSTPGEFGGVPRTLTAGNLVGPYRIVRLIQLGGASQVYEVEDTRTAQRWALKLLPVEVTRDQVLLMRFDDEAENLKKLDHPNVVALRDLGEDFGDRYLVFDLAPGGKVGSQTCRDLSDLSGPLPEAEIIRVGRQVCDALHYIHSRGILHRDLKPGNLLVFGERVAIADFGISRAPGCRGLTLTGLPVGTPEYMAPEQSLQEEVDRRTDLYALGCILYALATGRPPYRSDSPLTTAMYHVQATPPRIEDLNPAISHGLQNLIYKAIQKDPERRYQSARDLFDDLGVVDQDPAGPQVIEGQKMPQDALAEEQAREQREGIRFRRRLAISISSFVLLLFLALGGRPLYTHVQIQRLTAAARAAWESGPESWAACCARLQEAYVLAPTHDLVQQTLQDISSVGTLKLEAPGFEGSLRIEPKKESGRALKIPSTPRIVSDHDVIKNGGELRLTLGHYEVTPEIQGTPRPDLKMPVCLTQVEYREGPEGWKRVLRVLPRDLKPLEESTENGGKAFLFAERQVLDKLAFPGAVPEGFCFVNAGPFFRSEVDFSQPVGALANPNDDSRAGTVAVFKTFRLVEDDLQKNFLMASNPTTVKEFETWFRQFGEEYCKWMVEEEKVLLGRTTPRKVKAAVRGVPLELQLKYWASRLPSGASAEHIESSDQLVDIVFARELEGFQAKWKKRHEEIDRMLAAEPIKSRPVGHLDYHLALAFARTHSPIICSEFRTWLKAEIERSMMLEKQLEKLIDGLGRQPVEDNPERLVPQDLILAHRRGLDRIFDRHSVPDEYGVYLYYHVFYGAQVPAEQVVKWARENAASLAPALRSRLDEAEAGLKKPHQWLFEPSTTDGTQIYQPLLQHYGYWAVDTHRIHSPHFKTWLSSRVKGERERARFLEGYLETWSARGADEIVGGIPWELRLEYGWSMGHDLPDMRQWEKAFRGPDDREFPWGRDLNDTVLGLRDGPEPNEQLESFNLSPHKVQRLGGQVSEWVRSTFQYAGGDFLKGGNYRFDAAHCNGGFVFSVGAGQSYRWTGVRPIQEIRGGNDP